MLDLDQLLHHAVGQRASDLHVKVGARPHVRVDGRLEEVPFEVVEPDEAERLALSIMPPARALQFQQLGEVDFVHAIAGLGRFRVNAFRQRGRVGLVLRRVLPGIPGLDALGLPGVLAHLMDESAGLVLVSGLAGSGRTSTLAAMVDHVNQHSARHIVTIEDPIEVLHPDKQSIIDQREVGTDTPSVLSALVSALHQDPDVIVVGHLDGAETARAALEAADVGHLVVAGMTTISAADTLVRFVELFDEVEQRLVRGVLARSLRGIVCQRLAPRAGGRGRVPAVEVLVVNAPLANLLSTGELETRAVDRLVEEGEYYGMQSFDFALLELYRRGLIDSDAALAHASSPLTLRAQLEDFDRTRLAEAVPAPPMPGHSLPPSFAPPVTPPAPPLSMAGVGVPSMPPPPGGPSMPPPQSVSTMPPPPRIPTAP